MSRQVNTTSQDQPSSGVFAARLNEALVGTTSEAFARRIDKSLRTVMRWRAGRTEPNGADLVLIARELDRPPEWFFSEPDGIAA